MDGIAAVSILGFTGASVGHGAEQRPASARICANPRPLLADSLDQDQDPDLKSACQEQ